MNINECLIFIINSEKVMADIFFYSLYKRLLPLTLCVPQLQQVQRSLTQVLVNESVASAIAVKYIGFRPGNKACCLSL